MEQEQSYFERNGLGGLGEVKSGLPTQPSAPVKLYTPGHVVLATFFGSPAAGGHVLFLNYRRMGEPGKAIKTLALSVVGAGALFALAWFLPDKVGSAFAFAGIVGMRYLAHNLQGERVTAHQAAGLPMASGWKAAGIGIAWGLALVVGLVGFFLLTDAGPGQAVDIGHGATVYLQPGATEADAKLMGEELVKGGFLNDDGREIDILLGRGPDGPEFGFIVGNDNPINRASFESLARSLSPHLGGPPAVLRLLDPELNEKFRKKLE